MADLTQGITQMQSQLKPDMFAGYAQGANAYATAQKQGQDIAAKRIENEKAARDQEIQIRLQKAIEESMDSATGQPDYNKLASNGVKYGISQQQMDYTIKHIKENWATFADVAKNKMQVESTAKPNWNTQSPKEATVEKTSQLGTAPAPTNVTASQTGSVADTEAPTRTNVDGVPQAVQVKAPEGYEPTKVIEPWDDPAQSGIVAPNNEQFKQDTNPAFDQKVMDLGSGVINGSVSAPTNTLYANANNMEVQSPVLADIGKDIPKYGDAEVSALSAEAKQELVRGLRDAGINLPEDAKITNADIARGVSEVQNNTILALTKGYNPLDPQKAIGSIYEARALAPQAAQKAVQDLFNKGREIKTTRLGQVSTAQSTAQTATKFSQEQDPINSFRAKGIAANSANINDIQTKYTSVENLRDVTNTLKEKLDKETYKTQTTEEFAQDIKSIDNILNQAEGANTETLRKAMESGIRMPRNASQIWFNEGPSVQFFKELGKNLTAQDKKTVLSIYSTWATDALKHGKAASEYNALPRLKGWSKQQLSSKKERKPGETYADYLRRTK